MAVSAGGFAAALCVKAIAGPADYMARFVRGAKPQEPRPQTLGPPDQVDPATMKLAAGRGETACGCEALRRRRHPRAEVTLRREQMNPTGVAGTLTVPARSR